MKRISSIITLPAMFATMALVLPSTGCEDDNDDDDDHDHEEAGDDDDGMATGDDDDGMQPPPAGCADPADPNASFVIVQSNILADTTWTCDNIYVLAGSDVFVQGAVLTIQPGTRIEGRESAALVIEKDARIEAVGTADKPIVMTSSQPNPARGDWGGLVLLGNAVANIGTGLAEGFPTPPTYGGNNPAHNCGTLQYVRVEWAGFPLVEGSELNGITFYACGTETTVDHVQVYMGQDDGFEWFGGGFNASYLVSTGSADDSFDIDQGFQGQLQHLLVVQDALVGDNGFEISNNDTAFDATPVTRPMIANATVIGAGPVHDVKSRGFTLKEGTQATIQSTIFTNAKNGAALLTHQATENQATSGATVLTNNIFWNNGVPAFVAGGDDDAGTTWDNAAFEAWVNDPSRANLSIDPVLNANAATAPQAATGGATLGAGFTPTTYIGAVDPAGPNWTLEAWVRAYP
ncbi:MAG: hypothetical protein B7733_08760 [Myxococcales bacterium FL481]|nr:MAG: hypothetical protein B7733_08760 [Myxococcales bacterium FL481]